MAHSERIQRIPQALVENGGSLSAAMRAVGYGAGYAKNPSKLRKTKAWKETMEPVLKRLEKARDQAIERMEATVNEADYGQVSAGVERLTKQIQLISGKPTENVNHFATLSDEELAALVASRTDNGGEEGISKEGTVP